LSEGKTLKTIYSDEEYNFIKNELKAHTGYDVELFNNYEPFSLLMFVMEAQFNKDYDKTVDEYLYEKAKEKSKNIIGIENVDEQLALIKKIPYDYVYEYFKELDKGKELLERLILAYDKSDLEELLEIMQLDKSLVLFHDEFITQRNYIMAERIDDIIKQQSAFVAVGAGHLGGEKGLINLLKEKGYEVKPIIASKEFVEPNAKQEDKWYSFTSDESGFGIEMPAIPQEQIKQVASNFGELTLNIYIHQAKQESEENLLYMVMRTKYPEGSSIHSDSTAIIESFFQDAINGSVKSVNGELIEARDISFGDYPGKDIEISFQDGAIIISMRQILVNNYVYVLQVMTLANNKDNELIDKFYNSFYRK